MDEVRSLVYRLFEKKQLNMTTNEKENSSREWRPIDGVGQISHEQFVGNYMFDSDTSVNHFFYN